MPQAAIFDVDGTLVDSVDLHASAWQEALENFGHHVTFEQARSQIGKGGDQLIPRFLSEAEQRDHGKEMEEWRGKRFKSKYLPLVRPFSAVPELLQRVHDAGLKVAVASSAKASELEVYLGIACVRDLVDVATSADDAEQSKPAPDIFHAALKKLGMAGADAVAVGDTPYDAEAAGKAGIPTIGLLCGGFTEYELRKGGCVAVYPGPAAVLACFAASPLGATHQIGKAGAVVMPGDVVKPRADKSSRDAARASTMGEADLVVQEIYRSSNGDQWHLVREGSGRRFVRHRANASAGGQVTDTAIDEFLRIRGAGPEREELRRILCGEKTSAT